MQTIVLLLRFSRFFLDRGVGGWGQLYPNFYWIFGFFLYLQGRLGVKNKKLRKWKLRGDINLLKDQHRSFIPTPNVTFKVRNHVCPSRVCAFTDV